MCGVAWSIFNLRTRRTAEGTKREFIGGDSVLGQLLYNRVIERPVIKPNHTLITQSSCALLARGMTNSGVK